MYTNERNREVQGGEEHAPPEDARGGVAGTLVGDEEAATATVRQREESEAEPTMSRGFMASTLKGPRAATDMGRYMDRLSFLSSNFLLYFVFLGSSFLIIPRYFCFQKDILRLLGGLGGLPAPRLQASHNADLALAAAGGVGRLLDEQ